MRLFYGSIFFILVSMRCSAPNPSVKTTDTHAIYATRFAFTEKGAKVIEPWPGAKTPKYYQFDQVPKRIIATSTSHLPYLEMLGIGDRLVGFPGTKYISSAYFLQRVNEGQITDLGPDGNMNLELLFSLEPDLIIAFDMGSESGKLAKIESAGIRVVYNSDFLETSALGRAENPFFWSNFRRASQG